MRIYLLMVLRNLERERLYVAINIAGLSLGIACCLILGLYLHSELTYDQHNVRHRQIYRLVNEFNTSGSNDTFAITSRTIGPMLAEDYPDIVKGFVRFQSNSNAGGIAIRRGEAVYFWQNSYYASPNVFDVFTHQVLLGDPKAALQEGGHIAISASFAKKYFGDENPIGQVLTTDSGEAHQVSLVFADLPANTHLKYDVLFSDNTPSLRQADSATSRQRQLTFVNTYTYLVLDPSFRVSGWAATSDKFRAKYMEETLKSINAQWRSWLQPLRQVHFQSEVRNDLPNGNSVYLYGCAAVALIILVIACINYMNLATARAMRRARSVGIRKILGASRLLLAMQFLGEAILFAFVSLIVGVIIVKAVLKFTPINSLMGGQVSLDLLQQPLLLALLVGGTLAMGVLTGLYPAFYLSSWAPLSALTGKQSAGKGNLRLREILVLLQFTISAAAIACTLLMMAQMHYIADRPLGFQKENQLLVTMRGTTTIDMVPSIRNELAGNSHIQGVAVAGRALGQGASVNVLRVEHEDGQLQSSQSSNFAIGENFEKVLGLQIVQGRDLSTGLITDVGPNYLVNEAFVRKMRWTNPIGKRLEGNAGPGRVVGVAKDFNFKSLHTEIEPVVMYRLNMDSARVNEANRPFRQLLLVLKISAEDTAGTLAFVEDVMTRADPRHPFEFTFLDDSIDKLYKSESQLTRLLAIFSAISIFIACMGLFGLAVFTTEQRTREIGTRKVLGATTWQIIGLLSRRILLLVVVASVLAAAVSYFAIDEWLAGFAYRAGVNPLVFVLATAAVAAVSFATVALQAYRTASADPVQSLREV